MKLYNKLGLFAAGALVLASCAVNDPFDDNMEIGKVLPTVSWEIPSTVCKAGNDVAFLGKYYTTAEDAAIDHAEVWAMITRTESAAATQKLISSPAYTMTVNSTDTVRGFHLVQSYPHSEDYLVGTEYQLSSSFPTSRTLSPVTWASPSGQWDVDKFNMYYPDTMAASFCNHMVKELTEDSVYFSGLRSVYMNYAFTKEQFDAVNAKYPELTPLPFSDSVEEGSTKGDLWFEYDASTVVGYYYTTLVDSVTVEHEIATKEEAPADIDPAKIFEVYKAPHWVFCRYSDNTGGPVVSVRPEYMPMWKELIEMIPFEAWIYDSSNQVYAVEFTRSYQLTPQFKVVDTNGKVGTDTETKTVDLN